MTVAEDSFVKHAIQTGANPSGLTHTPTGTPAGIIVCIGQENTTAVTAVSWGGRTLTEVTNSPQVASSGEDVTASVWFSGDASDLALRSDDDIDITGAANDRAIGSYVVTADGDTAIVDTYGDAATSKVTTIGGTLSLGGDTCFCVQACASGVNGSTGTTSTKTGWTKDLSGDDPPGDGDLGSAVGEAHSFDTIGSSDVTCGFTQNNDDAALVAVAIKDSSAGAGGGLASGSLTTLGVGI